MSAVRKLALEALVRIFLKGVKPKDCLELLSENLDKRDRAFLMEVVYGVVRYRDTLDWMLADFLKKPQKLHPLTLNNLRTGTYQIFFMRVPEWAAVNEAVEMEKTSKKPLANAVLRNIIRNKEEIKNALVKMKDSLLSAPAETQEIVSYISTLTSHPKWLIKRWLRRFGQKEAFALAASNNKIPLLTLRVNTLKAQREDILKKLKSMGVHGKPTKYSPQGIILRELRSFRELESLKAYLTPQDEAAQLISYLLEPMPGQRVLDACAAPGGKTTHIAELMKDEGEIIAVDIDEKRVSKVRENISRLGLNSIRVVRADINDFSDRDFDRILLDAPCTASGIIRRNPDVKYKYKAKNLQEFKNKQLGMLSSVSKLIRPGGIIVYSTCSVEPEEGEDVIKSFLKGSKDFYIIKSDMPFLSAFYENGFLRTYPHRHGMDGFFGVRICRQA